MRGCSGKALCHSALAALAGAVVALAAGCQKPSGGDSGGSTPDAATVELTRAAQRAMEVTVHAQGALAAGQGASARVASPLAGRILAIAAREGDPVTKGQVLVTLDSRTQQAQAGSAAAALSTAEAQADEADLVASAAAADQGSAVHLASLALDAAIADRDSSTQQARTALETAQTDLNRIRAGSRPQEIAQAEQMVRQDQVTRDRAATELERIRSLFGSGIAARRQLDDAQTALDVGDATLESAKQQVSLLRAGPRPEEVRSAELSVKQASDALAQAQRSGDLKVLQARAALLQARQSALQVAAKRQDARAQQQNVAQKRADLAAARASASYAVLRAPLSGVVTRRALNPGDLADPAVPIVEIANPSGLDMIGELPAEDGLKIHAGMEAHIQAPDEAARSYEGRVLSVGQVDPQTNLLSVRIAVADLRGHLRAGAFVTADIVLRVDHNAVVVPREAVVNHESGSAVFVVGADSVAHQRDVTPGVEHDGMVEILKGISAGEQVVRLGQYELADGAKVQPAAKAQETGDQDK